jgi:hypothetical protein
LPEFDPALLTVADGRSCTSPNRFKVPTSAADVLDAQGLLEADALTEAIGAAAALPPWLPVTAHF